MRPFHYQRATDVAEASRLAAESGQGQTDAPAQFLAGGTTLIDLMKLDVITPSRVVDLGPMRGRMGGVEAGEGGLRLGAMATMAEAADHPAVVREYPLIAQSLRLAASAQLRNMATLGGNLLQRTRCAYYRDPSWAACNKRRPGSGCAAMAGVNRNHAVLGVDGTCIAQYPGDFAVALVALGAQLELYSAGGARTIAVEALHRPPSGRPHVENTLRPGEFIAAIRVPAGPWTRRSLYLKVRDRSSYEFALAGTAVALEMEGDIAREVRLAIAGAAYRPWRTREAEAVLTGRPLTEANAEAAARAAFAGAVTHGGNAFKPELGRRAMVRALLEARAMEV